MKKELVGINIQYPISEKILDGSKKIETRTYQLPEKYLNQELLLIETPGKNGDFKARGVAIIVFDKCFEYKTKTAFYKDTQLHLVDEKSDWAWKEKKKFGWHIKSCVKLKSIVEVPRYRGIIFTKKIKLKP